MPNYELVKKETNTPLKVFIFQDKAVGMHASVGYSVEEGIGAIKSKAGPECLYIGSIDVKEILGKVDLPTTEEVLDVKIDVPKSQFIFNTLYIADKYITSEKDRARLKSIISKIPITKDAASNK